MHTAYLYCEGTVKVILAALVKLAVCGAVGMVTAALLLDLTPTPYALNTEQAAGEAAACLKAIKPYRVVGE